MNYDGTYYGIFSDEADHLIALVYQHRPLHEIERIVCSKCGAPIQVGFWPDGGGFIIQCAGKPPHMSRYQAIASPPAWWRERIVEVTDHLDSRATA